LFLGLITASGWTPQAAAAPVDPNEKTVSSGRQFIIYGLGQKRRANLANRAEQVSKHLDQILKPQGNWQHPIVVRILSEEDAPKTGLPVRVALFDTGTGELKIQVDIASSATFDEKAYDRAILHALLLEFAFRDEKFVAGKPYRFAPSWLLEALAEQLHSPQNKLAPEIFDKLIDSGGPPKLPLFLAEQAERLDATSRAIYRARASALLSAILSERNGRLELLEYVQRTGREEATAKLFLETFRDSAGSPERLTRIWTLGLAKFSVQGRETVLDMAESAKRLTGLTQIQTPKDARNPEEGQLEGVEALIHLSRSREGRFSLDRLASQVNGLLWQAHPLFRPMTQEYHEILERLAAGKRRGIEKRYNENLELISAMTDHSSEIEDYLNWFSASQMPNRSGEFDEALEENEAEIVAEQLRQNDPIHKYLDALEARGWR